MTNKKDLGHLSVSEDKRSSKHVSEVNNRLISTEEIMTQLTLDLTLEEPKDSTGIRLNDKNSSHLKDKESHRSSVPFSARDLAPRLTYDTIEEYICEMSNKIYLEEIGSILSFEAPILTEKDFYFEENKCLNFVQECTICIRMTDEFKKTFISKKMDMMGKNPFFSGQVMIFLQPYTEPDFWTVDFTRIENDGSHVKSPSVQLLSVSMSSNSWAISRLCREPDYSKLKILPVSLPKSRSFSAFTRLKTSPFVDMLLGKTFEPQPTSLEERLNISQDKMNESQILAIRSVLTNRITLIQGPPGTGKTSTICNMISELLLRGKYPILIVAASNQAIDNIAEKLIKVHKDSVLKILARTSEFKYPMSHVLGPICLHNKIYAQASPDIRVLLDDIKYCRHQLEPKEYKQVLDQQIRCSQKIVGESKIFLTTSVSAGGVNLQKLGRVPIVIMDEATQSSEVASLIPLTLNQVKKVVLVGDEKQLNGFSNVPGLAFSLFERILANRSCKNSIFLDTQYRMHPAISEFPSQEFYDGKLKDGVTAEKHQKYGNISRPLMFWDTQKRCREERAISYYTGDYGSTYCNVGEVKRVEQILEYFIEVMHVEKTNIGVITPYSGQRDLISESASKNKKINPEGKRTVEESNNDYLEESKPATVHLVSEIMIASVDAFQGREKDFIILSCVRSNVQNIIGFLKDRRRLNVALTRAKFGLVIVGDLYCLKRGDCLWKRYISYLEKRKLVLSKLKFEYGRCE
ncbi:P-loop containing nucleoside triphosphate hydrolase protein [Metschnikowia bicuspidata var. bicuspidata NRRL YB-4993]|uniref:p-loop containing nucleoside triphosphate hydrolase protein n=1 Tax=Metschnikowia bicuspidata var. bicuspidata NRRL YB-4993 TaxID=869754 RepID=A0A1A0HEN7_9ASCO|nr:P-loop containing nucleoside triphosphate hydrolase protein [Metschnikowia bicuspidata var. bicuspidata NRRL YB-4993]OBA22373.1 P-loop containing nucleoside triphosphate hydrolase protein [Metschnikowia bicuspidata var. bicuspidata NRRL YB-4993]